MGPDARVVLIGSNMTPDFSPDYVADVLAGDSVDSSERDRVDSTGVLVTYLSHFRFGEFRRPAALASGLTLWIALQSCPTFIPHVVDIVGLTANAQVIGINADAIVATVTGH